MFPVNPNSVRSYKCDCCGKILTVTVIISIPGNDECECGGTYNIIVWEMKI